MLFKILLYEEKNEVTSMQIKEHTHTQKGFLA